jgi:DNA-binding transcriptional regulator YhcF (GntR family)
VGREAAQPPDLDIDIDRDAEIPIGVQLAWALRSRIRDGRLKPGERLPGLREMALATGVNVNTARAVYQRLEQEGLIDSHQGSGTFVASTPQPPSAVATIAADAAREAHETGVDPREVAAALYVSASAPPRPADDAATRRRALREQIAMLERTLGEMEANHPGVAPACEATRASVGPALLDEAELEQVRAQLVRRLASVQAAIDRLGAEPTVVENDERQPAHKSKRASRTRPTARPASELA